MAKGRLLPTGDCWDGCGAEVRRGAFFVRGHDKIAQAAVILSVYGGVPEFMRAHRFGPGGKNARRTWEKVRDLCH